MAVRIDTYAALLREDLIKSRRVKPGGRLPLAAPVMIYTGKSPWKAPAGIEELTEPDIAGLELLVSEQSYITLDLWRFPEKKLAPDDAVSIWIRMERSKNPNRLKELPRAWLVLFREQRHMPLNRAIEVWIVRVLRKNRIFKGRFPANMGLVRVYGMLDENIQHWAKNHVQKGIRKGRQEGRQEGLQEGRQEQGVRILPALHARRFGPEYVDSGVTERLRGASPGQAVVWAGRIFDAKTPDEAFNG
jgi:hypothetical protein